MLHGAGAQLPRSEASRLFADRLEMNYKPFVYKTYPNENYYVRRRENICPCVPRHLASSSTFL